MMGTAWKSAEELEAVAADTQLTKSSTPLRVVTYVKPVRQHTSDETALRILRSHFANELLPSLKGLADHCSEATAARYAADLLTTMRTIGDLAAADPFVEVIMAFHDALAFENRWATYSSEQYSAAFEILLKLGQRSTVPDDRAEKAMMELEDLGFDTTPFELGEEVGL